MLQGGGGGCAPSHLTSRAMKQAEHVALLSTVLASPALKNTGPHVKFKSMSFRPLFYLAKHLFSGGSVGVNQRSENHLCGCLAQHRARVPCVRE